MKAELQVQTQKEHLLQATAENRKQLHKIKYKNPMTAMNNLQRVEFYVLTLNCMFIIHFC
jgi:hypothetical protein